MYETWRKLALLTVVLLLATLVAGSAKSCGPGKGGRVFTHWCVAEDVRDCGPGNWIFVRYNRAGIPVYKLEIGRASGLVFTTPLGRTARQPH
jgi:hypothetical protein